MTKLSQKPPKCWLKHDFSPKKHQKNEHQQITAPHLMFKRRKNQEVELKNRNLQWQMHVCFAIIIKLGRLFLFWVDIFRIAKNCIESTTSEAKRTMLILFAITETFDACYFTPFAIKEMSSEEKLISEFNLPIRTTKQHMTKNSLCELFTIKFMPSHD